MTGTTLGSGKRAASVLRRSLRGRDHTDSGAPDPIRLLEAVAEPDGRVRAFFAQGTNVALFAPGGVTVGAAQPKIRDVAGAVLVTLDRPGPLALASGRSLAIDAAQQETALFAGRDTVLAFRLEETVEQVAEGLIYHATQHGMTGALIVNRLPGPQPDRFVRALRRALGDVALLVVVLDCPLPLGKPGQGPENHPYLAPDAPGKDRMTVPGADPWRAPLGEALIFEALKWRFLAQARAVLTLDVSDILAPRTSGAPSAFDLCVAAKGGVIRLAGRQIYPWRVRPGDQPRFGDHICHAFDARRGIARWGVAPAKAGLRAVWRMVGVARARPGPGGAATFLRAMAIRVPGRTSGELVPKTALTEDPVLIDLATQTFGHDPVRAPVSVPRSAAVAAHDCGRVAIVTTMKNEGPFILEWLAYHRAIGVDDFLIYTNDCTDGTDTLLDLLQRKGLVQHRDNPYRSSGLKPQHAALQAAEAEPLMQGCGWGICMDVDEFITIHIGDGTLRALFAAMGDANMISLTWRLFGNSRLHGYDDRFITEQFTRCAPEVVRKPHQAWGFKTLFRTTEIYRKLGVHRPKGLRPGLWDQIRWLNGSGVPLPRKMFRNGWRSSLETYGYDWVTLNHYAVRSAGSFLVKRDRGRVNHVDRDQGLNYWFRMNMNACEDRSILRMIPSARAEYDRLLADPEIAAAHAHSVACHRDKIAALRATDAYGRFYDELTGARMEALCRMQHHFGSSVFNAGPEAIPPDLHLRDLAPDFCFTVGHSGEAEH